MTFGFQNMAVAHEGVSYIHCVPVDDIQPHKLAEDCTCRPREDQQVPDFWVHNAWDDRESYFEHGRALH